MHRYNTETQSWDSSENSNEIHQIDNLSLVTYNVLLNTLNGKQRLFPYIFQHDIRYRNILDELKRIQPLFISLNEVTRYMLDMIEGEDWIQENYYMSVDEKLVASNGNVWLSRLNPVLTHQINMPESLKPVITNVYNIRMNNKEFTMTFSSVHLTSIDKNYKIRERQFDALHNQLLIINENGPNILAGDMNFHSEDENKVFLSKNYRECWLQINDNKEGYTFDAENNKLIQVMFFGFEHRRMRLDRILVYDKDDLLKPNNIEIIGTEPIYPDISCKNTSKPYGWLLLLKGLNPYNLESNYGRYLYNSDHFGLSAQLT